jgi:AraC family transcriptional regulator
VKNDALPHENEHQKFNSRLSKLGVSPTISIADRHGLGLLAHASFDAAEGHHAPAPWLMLNLCTGHIGRMRRVGDGPTLDGILRPGTVAVALPNTTASGFWCKTQMLGIAVNLNRLEACNEKVVTRDNFEAAASRLHNDALLTSVMTALWRNAEVHGLSGAFFEHGIDVLLKHLASFQIKQKPQSLAFPLKGTHLRQVLDLMESRLGDDIRVAELAALVGQDLRTFTRSFQAATGYAPYAYFTLRRMEYAKLLLQDKQCGITEISFRVGYTNPSKFSAAFRRVCGVTPSVWRQLGNSS